MGHWSLVMGDWLWVMGDGGAGASEADQAVDQLHNLLDSANQFTGLGGEQACLKTDFNLGQEFGSRGPGHNEKMSGVLGGSPFGPLGQVGRNAYGRTANLIQKAVIWPGAGLSCDTVNIHRKRFGLLPAFKIPAFHFLLGNWLLVMGGW